VSFEKREYRRLIEAPESCVPWIATSIRAGNIVRQAVTRERGRQAKSSHGNSVSDLQKILVDVRCIRPSIQAPADLFNNPSVSIGVKTLCGETASDGLGRPKEVFVGQTLVDSSV
jgi:hypothetical protein